MDSSAPWTSDPAAGRARLEPPLELGEAVRGEQALEQGATLVGAGPEEPAELALGQHDDLVELVGVHVEVLAEQRVGLSGLGRPGHPLAGDQLFDGGVGWVLAQALAALLGAELARAPHDPVARRAQGELEADLGGEGGRCVVGAHLDARGARAGEAPEERERHGVEHRRLARARGAVQQEQPGLGEPIEVDLLAAGEGPERRDGELVEAHQADTSAMRCASNPARTWASSRSPSGRPQASAAKRVTRPMSSSPSSREV